MIIEESEREIRVDGEVVDPLLQFSQPRPVPMVSLAIQCVLSPDARTAVAELVQQISSIVQADIKRAQEQYARPAPDQYEALGGSAEKVAEARAAAQSGQGHDGQPLYDCPHCGRPDADKAHRLRCMQAAAMGEEPPP